MTTVPFRVCTQAVEVTIKTWSSTAPGRSTPHRLVVTLLLIATLGLVSAQHTLAAEQVPFRGSFTTDHAMAAPCGPMTLCIVLSGTGEATHLGWTEFLKNSRSTRTTEACPGGAINTYTAAITLTADGDTITMSGSGTVCEGPGLVQASGTYTVTGGTGRFSGASGTITERFERLGAIVYVTLTGTISSPGSVK